MVKLPETEYNFEQIEKDSKLIEEAIGARRKRFRFNFQEPVEKSHVITFVVLQMADVYTTYRGLKYDCVYETNPILGKNPNVQSMLLTKAIVLTPALKLDYDKGKLTPKIMSEMNFLMSLVIANNYDVLREAKKYCVKK